MSSAAHNLILRSKPVTPDRLPGLAAWYSADYGVLTAVGPDVAATNGQTVRRWLDRSGNGRNLDQTTLVEQMTLGASGGPAAQPALVGNGTQWMYTAAFTWPAVSTIYCVFKADVWQANDIVYDGGNGDNFALRQNTSSPNMRALLGGSDVPVSIADWHATAVVYASSGVFILDGQQISTGNYSSSGNLGFTIFERIGAINRRLQGSICEYINFTAAHDQGQRNSVLKYIRRKYGL